MNHLGSPAGWDHEVDVVVVGFGAAGSTAAIAASEHGLSVLALDRWGRGGASARSGGVIFAGGGTDQQRAAGFDDSPELMEQYLALEEEVSPDDDLVRRFCERSAADLRWLGRLGVRFPAGYDARKSVVPPDDGTGLYFSGNEHHFADRTPAVPRGHRVAGQGMTGHDLVAALHREAQRRGVEVLERARPARLVTDDAGAVIGVEVVVLDGDRVSRAAHTALYRLVDLAAPVLRRVPETLTAALDGLEHRRGRVLGVRARRGVVLATGGFSFNHELMRSHAPRYASAMPLGTPGDDGSGILLARRLGASVRLMDRCGASRFVAPPTAFCRGVLVDRSGDRICDESLYAATISMHLADHGGRGWLIVDDRLRASVAEQIGELAHLRGRPWRVIVSGRANHVVFPRLFGWVNLHLNRVRRGTLDELAEACGLPADRLRETIERYNRRAREALPDEMGKPAEHVRPVEVPPFAAVPLHLDGVLFPAPCITLGGLDVDTTTQQVRRSDGSTIPGLYAVGRCAAGVASRSYVSGLSLADCVFSGRNAGTALAETAGERRRSVER